MNCLLIETKDKRKFFTHEKNFHQLIEFSKTFNASISVVKLEKGPVLDLEQLAPAICNQSKPEKANYEVIETKLSVKSRNRLDTLRSAKRIKRYIFETFSHGRVVSLRELKKKFKKYSLSDAALCNHVRRVKKELEKEGIKIAKVGAGKYKVK